MRMRAERCQMRSVTPGVRALKNKRGVESVQHPQSLQLAGPCAKMHWSVSKDVCCAHDARVQLDDNAQSRDMSAPCRQVRSCTFNRYHVRSDYGATHLQHNFAQAPGSARFKGGGVGVDLFAQTCCAHTRRLGAHPSHSRAACCDRVRRWPALMLRAKSARPPERPPATPGQRSCARRWASARHRARAAGLPRALSPTIPGCQKLGADDDLVLEMIAPLHSPDPSMQLLSTSGKRLCNFRQHAQDSVPFPGPVFELVSSSHTPGGWAQKRALAGARTCPHCL